LERVRRADRSRRAARAPRARSGRAAAARQARLPDRRALPRRARRRHAAVGGQRPRPRPPRPAPARRGEHRRRHCPPGVVAVTREALGRLAHKYARLLELRRDRAAGKPIPERAVFRVLADEFPGALYELDTLPLDALEARAAETAAA